MIQEINNTRVVETESIKSCLDRFFPLKALEHGAIQNVEIVNEKMSHRKQNLYDTGGTGVKNDTRRTRV